MRPSTHQPISAQKLTSTGTGDPQTATIPNNASAILLTVETTSVRMTLTLAGDPTSTTGHVIQKDQNPWHMLIGQGSTLKVASATAGTSVTQITYLQ